MKYFVLVEFAIRVVLIVVSFFLGIAGFAGLVFLSINNWSEFLQCVVFASNLTLSILPLPGSILLDSKRRFIVIAVYSGLLLMGFVVMGWYLSANNAFSLVPDSAYEALKYSLSGWVRKPSAEMLVAGLYAAIPIWSLALASARSRALWCGHRI